MIKKVINLHEKTDFKNEPLKKKMCPINMK